ncbi:hypothetical protein ACE6H2_011205 [Prunus campanulata]
MQRVAVSPQEQANIDAAKKNRIQVSNTKKPLFFYVNLAKERKGKGKGKLNLVCCEYAGSVKNLEDSQHEQMDNDLADSWDEKAQYKILFDLRSSILRFGLVVDLLLCFGLSCGYKFVIFDSVIILIEVRFKTDFFKSMVS